MTYRAIAEARTNRTMKPATRRAVMPRCKHRFESEDGAYELGRCPLRKGHDGEHQSDPDYDKRDGRLGFYAEMACSKPGWNVRITL